MWVKPIRTADEEAIAFDAQTFDTITKIDRELLNAKNTLQDLVVKGIDGKDRDTLQSYQVGETTHDPATGTFWGTIECGARGQRSRIHKRDGTKLGKDFDDADCEEFYFRFELPPGERQGVLICQRIGMRSAASTLIAFLKKAFFEVDHTLQARPLTDRRKFDAYTDGMVHAIRYTYKRRPNDPREVVRKTRAFGRPVTKGGGIELTVKMNRPMWSQLWSAIEGWTSSEPNDALGEFNVLPGEPDETDVWVEDPITRSPKILNAQNAAELAVAEDVTFEVQRDELGVPLLDSLNQLAAALGQRLRHQLAVRI